jgi:hydrogenase nickel incorporation protein HypA/HybF
MHEIGLCESLLAAVERRAAGRRVDGVTFRVGVLHRVVPASMDQAFELVSGGTVAEGATVHLVSVPVTVTCRGCGAEATSEELITICPSCGAAGPDITAGDELILESIRLAAPAAGPR